jgi:hypothetical protein
VIEIFTSESETAGPSQNWLGFVKSRQAHPKIRRYVSKVRRERRTETFPTPSAPLGHGEPNATTWFSTPANKHR